MEADRLTSQQPAGPTPAPVLLSDSSRLDLGFITRAGASTTSPPPAVIDSTPHSEPADGPKPAPMLLSDSSRLELGFITRAGASTTSPPPAVFNPTPHSVPAYGSSCACPNPVLLDSVPASRDRLVIAMVGLPGRGKTFVARRIANYLSFFHGVAVKNINVGEVLRRASGGTLVRGDCYDPQNVQMAELLLEARTRSLELAIDFLESGTQFSKAAILDGLNSNAERRRWLLDRLKGHGCTVLFIESVVTDEERLERNVRNIVSTLPDYSALSSDAALADFRTRMHHCEGLAQSLDEDGSEAHLSWIRMRNFSRYEVNNVHGFLQGRVAQLVMNLTDTTHDFYLTRHGQSEYNLRGQIGGDSPLTADGRKYAERLGEFARKVICKDAQGNEVPARLWTSGLRRTKETAAFIEHPTLEVCLPPPLGKVQWVQMKAREWRNLDEIFAGICDGMTYEEIAATYPHEFELRAQDKLGYRYPRGESYLDVCHRLEPIIMEMERTKEPLLIVAHQGILRLIYAYFMGIERAAAPHVSIPLNTVIQLNPSTYACSETRELLHTHFASNADGQAEPHADEAAVENIRAALKQHGLGAAPSRSQLRGPGSERNLTFKTFSVEPSLAKVRPHAEEPVACGQDGDATDQRGGDARAPHGGSDELVCAAAARVAKEVASWLDSPPSH